MKKRALILILLCFSVSVIFSQAIVRTNIASNPSGATVYIDGSRIGQTPLEFRFRDGKMYKIELRKDNYHSLSFNYRGGSGNINKRLEQMAPPKPAHGQNKMSSPSYEEPNRPHQRYNEPPHHNFPNDKSHRVPPKRRYTLTITSDVPGHVIIDKRVIGRTPSRVELEEGWHDVMVNSPGRHDYHEQINLNHDKDIFIRFKK